MTTAYQGDKPYVFLSYSHKDEELALSVIEYLQEHSFNVWYDESIHSGTQWEDVIIDKIANCSAMVFLATQNSLASDWCRQELNFAKEKGKRFINVVIGSPLFPDWFICDFTCYQFVNESEFASRDAMMDKLVKELIHHEMDTDKPKDTPKDTTKDTPTPSPTEGLEFTVTDGTARVDRYKGTDSKVIIPATIIRDGKTYKVMSIGDRAFYHCSSLTSITIPNSVTTIGKEAFQDCTNLTSITIPDGVTSIGESALWWCSSLTSITIPDSVTYIGNYAFYECSSLTSISIPNSVTTIGESAFSGCSSLTSITIPDSVKSIGFGAFSFCENLTIYCEAKSKPRKWHAYWNPRNRPVVWGHGNSEQPTAPKGLLELVSDDGLKFTVTDGIAKVTGYTGSDTKVIIPAAITYNDKTYKVTSIGKSAFNDCTNLTSITIPDSVTSIVVWAFWGCSSLTSITIPNSVTSIGKMAFYDCTNLTSITIPDHVTTIGEGAFWDCTNLTSITIPDSVTSIGHDAFYKCKNLTIYCEAKSKPEGWHAKWNPHNRPVVWGYGSSSPKENEVCESSKPSTDSTTTPKPSPTEGLKFTVTGGTATVTGYKGTDTKVIIPATIIRDGKTYKVTSIGEEAFYDCKDLTAVSIPNSVTSIGESSFWGCSSLISITIPDSVTSIGVQAFYNCYNLTSITIPNSVTTIGVSAFSYCTNLTSITIPDSVTSIGNYAFWDCKNLTAINVDKNNTHYKSIDGNLYSKDGTTLIRYAIGKTDTTSTIPDHVTTIGVSAFSYCTNLTSVTIPNSVTSIGRSAFAHCKNLTSITIPDSVTTIGELAFNNCKNLTIYCEAKSKPYKWHIDWNPDNRPVVWGYKLK